MRCPKCGHTQVSTEECEACGLIFARYKAVQERKRKAAEEKANAESSSSGSGLKLSSVFVLVLVAVAATYYFTSGKSDQVPSTPVPLLAASDPTPEPAPSQSHPAKTVKTVSSSSSHGASIADAGAATVSIETPFGTGSGFFIREEWIITNRHVIEVDSKKTAEMRSKYEKAKRYTDLEDQKLRGYRKRLRTVPEGPEKSQIIMIIEQKEEELAEALGKLKSIEEQLERLEQPIGASDIKVILSDGSEHYANYLQVSDSYDLAILSLFASNHKVLNRGGRPLSQGDKVYTIGSPVGLRQTVTAGIFSGYRKKVENGQRMLQTDAPINPGNSGGPLIDEHGYVHGVNTSIIRGTEGIGFAIPIDAVYTEFPTLTQ